MFRTPALGSVDLGPVPNSLTAWGEIINSMQSALFLAGPISLLVQILFCVHVYKTGRPYWWIWIILMSSFIGCLLYGILELLPEARRSSRSLVRSSWFVPKTVIIRRARERLDESDTIDARLELAGVLYDSGDAQEAEQVASPAVAGVFKDDAALIAEVAWYQIEVGKIDEADQLIGQANIQANKSMAPKLELLRARIQLARGEFGRALEEFERLKDKSLGEEPRYYAAKCLLGLNRQQDARALLDAIQVKYRKSNRMWRRSEKPWYQRSKELAAELDQVKR